MVAVYSETSSDYVRAKASNGSVQPETYAFGEGGFLPGVISDPTLEQVDFKTLAHTLAATLARRKYLPATDPARTRLLIMVYWGMTSGSVDLGFLPIGDDVSMGLSGGRLNEFSSLYAAQEQARDRIDYQNAGLLGYNADGLIGTEEGYWLRTNTALRHKVDDDLTDVESSRYFVVLMAYDFQTMWRQKEPKLLWVTRLSIEQRRNDFARELPAMLKTASPYFGRSSRGLIREVVPEGRVEVGQPKSLGVEPEK